MLYFKNQQLTSTYRVALNTVLNWIKAAQSGKLSLELTKVGERYYIANTAKNVSVIERLVEERKKYRNSRTSRVATPSAKFYELYNENQIIDIISNLDIHHEIPLQYGYFDGGAEYWQDYSSRMAQDSAPNLLTRTAKLFALNSHYIDELIEGFEHVNIVDIGPGNGQPVKDLLGHLNQLGVLNKYIGIDLSPDILDLVGRNVQAWFDGSVKFEGHVIDITKDRFGHILAPESLDNKAANTINIVVFLGGTICNLRNPEDALKVIQHSLGRNDLFIHSTKLDTLQSRRFFDFSSKPGASSLATNQRLVLDLLQIDPEWYEVEMGYDTVKNQRYIQARLLVSAKINFQLAGGNKSVLLEKGDSVLLWRFWQQNSVQVLQQLITGGFYPLHVSQTNDREYILTISRVKTESD